MLSGSGQLWADDFQVLIDGKEISEAKPLVMKKFNADKDVEFDDGVSRISSIKLSPSKIEDLALLGKVWGFLKYYHPKIAEGEYNWDYELLRVMPKIVSSQSSRETNSALSDWIVKLGETKGGDKSVIKTDVKLSPDLAWINKTDLGENLYRQLVLVKEAKRSSNNYYVELISNINNPVFTHENSYSSLASPDAGFRLLSLFRYWNTIQYYFPYKNLIGENWNGVLKEFIPNFVNAPSQREYKLAALELIARIHDTHANIWSEDMTPGKKFSAVEITFIENKAVVTGFLDEKTSELSGLKKGDIIESINKKSVEDIVKEKLSLTPASNYETQLRDIGLRLLKTDDENLSVTYSRAGFSSTISLATYPPGNINVFKKFNRTDTCFRMISPEIAYFFGGTLKSKYLPTLFSKIGDTKGLIIDFRSYPSDFLVFSLNEFLMPTSTPFARFSAPSITSPGQFIMKPPIEAGKNNPDYYKGKVVILINELTQSSAEYHTMAFRASPNATVIGSKTAGADGNVSTIMLPGGIRTMISGIGVYYPDGRETQRIGIVPDIEVKPTIKGITEGRDEVLEKAIELINKK